jgi:hypothetical protein
MLSAESRPAALTTIFHSRFEHMIGFGRLRVVWNAEEGNTRLKRT